MAWFLTLNPGLGKDGRSVTYELAPNVDIERVTMQMTHFSGPDRAVAIPVLYNGTQKVTLYVRPSAWAMWVIYEMDQQERREMIAARLKTMSQLQAMKVAHQQSQSSTSSQPVPSSGVSQGGSATKIGVSPTSLPASLRTGDSPAR